MQRMKNDPRILFEDQELLVVHKCAGMATQSARPGERDLLRALKTLRAGRGEDGNAFLTPIHRLDQPVEGLVVFAKTKHAAAFLSESLKKGEFQKLYRALCVVQTPEGEKNPPSQEAFRVPQETEIPLTDVLVREGNNFVRVAKEGEDGKVAKLLLTLEGGFREYETAENPVTVQLVSVTLLTGRHHQIRVQLSHAGLPILGDRKYGAVPSGYRDALALSAVKLSFPDLKTGKSQTFEIEPWFLK